jgi:Cdc6-like AAA superfamily ATPase
MSYDWDAVRAGWESARHAADSGLGATGDAQLARGRFGLALRPVTITGSPGTGKTVLYDALTGNVRSGSADSTRSSDVERHHTAFRSGGDRRKASFAVLQGQDSKERTTALENMTENKKSPHGIIHVTCWGHNRVWESSGERAIEETLRREHPGFGTEEVRAWHLEKETAAFHDLCTRLFNRKNAERLKWLIVAVSKADLYWERISAARDHYIPHNPAHESEFCTLLRDLTNSRDIQVAVLPMSSRLIAHRFLPNLPKRLFQLDYVQIGALGQHFTRTLQGFLDS